MRFMERTLNSMFPHYMTALVSDEPVVKNGSDEYNARVWFEHAIEPDIVVTFRWFTPNVQITTTVNA